MAGESTSLHPDRMSPISTKKKSYFNTMPDDERGRPVPVTGRFETRAELEQYAHERFAKGWSKARIGRGAGVSATTIRRIVTGIY